MIRSIKKSLVHVLVLATVMAMTAGYAFSADLPGKGVKVNSARATWTTGFFLEALVSQGLKDLGYDVSKPRDLANPIFYQAVTQGDVDFWANGWFPLHNSQLPKNFQDKAEIAGVIASAGALQGYLVSKKAVEEFKIKSLEDFKRDEVKKAFDANKDGKADLVGCPPGWGCEKAITFHMKEYKLNPDINVIKANYTAAMADALARYNAGEPIFFYTWTPNWTVFKLKPGQDVVWINVPENIPMPTETEFKDAMTRTGVVGAVTDPLQMGFPANDIDIVANKEFLKKNPAAAKFFDLIKVPLADIAAQNNAMYEGADKPSDIQKQVDEWIQKNKTKWDEWMKAAVEAAK